MCLGIPMRVLSMDGLEALCGARGVERRISLFLLQWESITVGDYLMVHVGYAIQRINEADALASWELFDDILAQQKNHD